MNKAVVLIGIGEMGGVFARGILKAGYPVFPVKRNDDPIQLAQEIPDPSAVVVAVGEKDVQRVLGSIPPIWHRKLVLLQNELLPRDWQTHKIENPTVISVWFEKKAGQDVKVIVPSPVFGPLADFIKTALREIRIECRVLSDQEEMLRELVIKNVYILTVNIAGLLVGGTVGVLWEKHQELAKAVADDVMDIQFKLIGKELDRGELIKGMVKAFNGDLDHQCMGRSATVRLERAIGQADEFGLEVKKLREILNRKEHVSM